MGLRENFEKFKNLFFQTTDFQDHFDSAVSYKLKGTGIKDEAITKNLIGDDIITEVTFLTINKNFQAVFNLVCTFGSAVATFDVEIPAGTFYAIYGGTLLSVSNAGSTLTSSNSNPHVLLLNRSTRALSLVDYTSFAATYNFNDYLIAGYVYGRYERFDINADFTINGVLPNLSRDEYTTTNLLTDTTKERQLIDGYGKMIPTPTSNASGTFNFNKTTKVYEIGAAGTGYSGVRFDSAFPMETGVDYYVYAEYKRLSGDASGTKEWRIGYPTTAAQYVPFTPTDAWQSIEGTINLVSANMFICAANVVTNQVVQFRNVRIYKKTTGSAGSWDTDLATSLSLYDNVAVPEGTHTIDTTINITSGKKITGVKGKSILQADASLLKVLNIGTGVTDVEIDGLTIKGTMSNYAYNAGGLVAGAGIISTVAEAIAQTNMGTQIGIDIDGAHGITLSNCNIKNFDKAGIEIANSGFEYGNGFKIIGSTIEQCYMGLHLEDDSEFSNILGTTVRQCQIGAYVLGGNLLFNASFFQQCVVGFLMSASTNDTHGSITGCSFNHHTLHGMIFNTIDNGEMITGSQHWYGSIYLLNSRGIFFNGCEIAQTSFYVDGNSASGGMNLMTNCAIKNLTMYEDYLGNVSNLIMKNNWKIDGTSSVAYNN